MKRVVADTNVLISALIFRGVPGAFLASARRGEFELVTSLDLLDELDEILRRKFEKQSAEAGEIRDDFESFAVIVSTIRRLSVVTSDPDDDRVLECAIAGRADFIVRGDRHLLNLNSYESVPILTIRQFLDRHNPPT